MKSISGHILRCYCIMLLFHNKIKGKFAYGTYEKIICLVLNDEG